MKVEEVMTHPVVSVREDTPFKEIAETLIDNDVSAVPVVDDCGCVIGIVTEADLLAKEAYPGEPKRGVRTLIADIVAGRRLEWLYKAQATKAWDVMTPRIVSAAPDDDVHTAARKMLEHRVKRLVVLDEGKPVGMVSRVDIIKVLARSDQDLCDSIERLLARCGFVAPDYAIRTKVSGGMVTLEGSVLYENDIRIAGSVVTAVDGVVSVENWLLYRFPDPDRRTVPVRT